MARFGSTLQHSWDWRAAGNFMFGGTGSALMCLAALAYRGEPLPLPVGGLALAFVALGLTLVWLEIGRPWRFLNVFFHPHTSWMTREASVATVMFAAATIGILAQQPVFVALAGLAGLGFLFCQGRILKASKGIPAWREPAIVPFVMATGLVEGAAVLVLASLVTDSYQHWVAVFMAVAVVVRLFVWMQYLKRLRASRAPARTLEILGGTHTAFVVFGNVVPAVLVANSIFTPGLMHGMVAAASVVALVAGWHIKFMIVARASQNQGYAMGKLNKGRPTPRPPVRRGTGRSAS